LNQKYKSLLDYSKIDCIQYGDPVVNREELENLFHERGYEDFRWIDPKEFVISFWVRMKCMYGCPNYGNHASCPPHVPSFSECQQFFQEYKECTIFHFPKQFDDPEERHVWTKGVNQKLSKLEREVFLSGFEKTFLLFMDTCELCDECQVLPENCKHPKFPRPTPEALCIDVFSTVRKVGYPINVLKDYSETMNRYAFLLIE